MTIQKTESLGKIVAQHPATAIVFTKYNIDFCCQGKKTLEEATEEKKIDLESILKELLEKSQEKKTDDRDWTKVDDIELIIDYINNTYHEPIKEMLPELDRLSEKVARVHGDHHPELLEIREIVEGLIPVIDMHFQKEEHVLQPMMRALGESDEDDHDFHCGSIQNPIRQMEYEHENYGAFLFKLRELTNNYTLPEGACMSYTTLYELLKKMDDDLQKHTHLENFVLHPLAIKKESGEEVTPSCCGTCH